MPAQQRRGLDEEERRPPGADVPGEQHQERPIRPRRHRARDAATQDEHLLAHPSILDEGLGVAP
jgi:hypothetical protein